MLLRCFNIFFSIISLSSKYLLFNFIAFSCNFNNLKSFNLFKDVKLLFFSFNKLFLLLLLLFLKSTYFLYKLLISFSFISLQVDIFN